MIATDTRPTTEAMTNNRVDVIPSANHTAGNDNPNCQGKSLSVMMRNMNGLADKQAKLEAAAATELLDLIKAVQAGDRAAFGRLYDTTVQYMFGLALRITRQRELAEEVISDLYLQVWQQAGSYSPERGKVIAWLSVLCRSRALDTLRRDNSGIRQATVGLDAVAEPQDSYQPLELLQTMQQGSAIHAALKRLTEDQRQLIALAYFRGYTHSELANFLSIPIGTVKTHLRRAMIKLRELMSNGAEMCGEAHG